MRIASLYIYTAAINGVFYIHFLRRGRIKTTPYSHVDINLDHSIPQISLKKNTLAHAQRINDGYAPEKQHNRIALYFQPSMHASSIGYFFTKFHHNRITR